MRRGRGLARTSDGWALSHAFMGCAGGVAMLVLSPRSSCYSWLVAPSLQPPFSASFLVSSRHRPLWGSWHLGRWRPMLRVCVRSRSCLPTGASFHEADGRRLRPLDTRVLSVMLQRRSFAPGGRGSKFLSRNGGVVATIPRGSGDFSLCVGANLVGRALWDRARALSLRLPCTVVKICPRASLPSSMAIQCLVLPVYCLSCPSLSIPTPRSVHSPASIAHYGRR
jgi:hypothetical protein